MAATSAFTAKAEPKHVSLDTVPLEILNKIFFFASDDDCDLGLALSSKSMATKLQDHPIVRLLLGLLANDQLGTVFLGYFEWETAAACQLLFPCHSVDADEEPVMGQDDLAGANWCTASFIGKVQITLIKRILKTYWDPLLARDKQPPSTLSHVYMWAELDEFENNPEALRAEWLIESRIDAVAGRYPWSRVYIWPRQGRVLIRDQLVNRTKQYTIPLLENFLRVKKSSTASKAAGNAPA